MEVFANHTSLNGFSLSSITSDVLVGKSFLGTWWLVDILCVMRTLSVSLCSSPVSVQLEVLLNIWFYYIFSFPGCPAFDDSDSLEDGLQVSPKTGVLIFSMYLCVYLLALRFAVGLTPLLTSLVCVWVLLLVLESRKQGRGKSVLLQALLSSTLSVVFRIWVCLNSQGLTLPSFAGELSSVPTA